MKLRNSRRGYYILNQRLQRSDTTILFEKTVVKGGEIADLPEDDPKIQRAARRGILVPVDATGQKWLASLEKKATRATP